MPLFFAIALIVILSLLTFIYIKTKSNLAQFRSKITVDEVELKKSQETEQSLRKDLSALQDKLRNAIEDPITNLLGWRLFEDRLHHSIQESSRSQLTIGVVVVDVDDFKLVNDALGYDIGNKLLAEVGKRLQTCIRQIDSISRFNKDTFVILLAQLAKPETAAMVA